MAHIGEEGRLGGVGGLGFVAFVHGIVAGPRQCPRHILDLEAQADILLELGDEAPAIDIEVDGVKRRQHRDADIQPFAMQQEAQRGHGDDGGHAGQQHGPAAQAADQQRRHSGGDRQQDIDMVGEIAVAPQQPGEQPPGGADGQLRQGEARAPARQFGVWIDAVGGIQAVDAEGDRRHHPRKSHRLPERSVAEPAHRVRCQQRQDERPEWR